MLLAIPSSREQSPSIQSLNISTSRRIGSPLLAVIILDLLGSVAGAAGWQLIDDVITDTRFLENSGISFKPAIYLLNNLMGGGAQALSYLATYLTFSWCLNKWFGWEKLIWSNTHLPVKALFSFTSGCLWGPSVDLSDLIGGYEDSAETNLPAARAVLNISFISIGYLFSQFLAQQISQCCCKRCLKKTELSWDKLLRGASSDVGFWIDTITPWPSAEGYRDIGGAVLYTAIGALVGEAFIYLINNLCLSRMQDRGSAICCANRNRSTTASVMHSDWLREEETKASVSKCCPKWECGNSESEEDDSHYTYLNSSP